VNHQSTISTTSKPPYPFGMHMPGRSFSSGSYRYGFNGMENDNEIKGDGNSLDFGARIYDSRLGRFLSVDPLYESYPSYSTYLISGNNPIYFIDISGKYKYPGDKEAEYKTDYPMITLYLSKMVENDVMGSPTILNGFKKYSGGNLTNAETRKAVKWGSGPNIVFDPDMAYNDDGTAYFGTYVYENNTIKINKKYADKVEKILQGNGSDQEKLYALYGFYATLTHETVHYGDYLDGARQDGGEPGEEFEIEVFQSKDVEINGKTYRQNQIINAQSNGEELVNMQIKEGKEDVLPTIPKKKTE
jgi:RHS repeat-associated protein